jgi:hypothetical protein
MAHNAGFTDNSQDSLGSQATLTGIDVMSSSMLP